MMKYKVGDAVKIKDLDEFKKCANINSAGEMDHWAGKIMTIRKVYTNGYKMNEDAKEPTRINGWSWDDTMIECLVDPGIKNINQDDLMRFLER